MASEVTWVGHATVLIEIDGVRLLTDPIVRNRVGPLVRVVPPVPRESTAHIDAVLLSHLHSDHADPPSLRRVDGAGMVLAPRGAGPWLRRRGVADVHELRAGDEITVGSLRVTAATAVHDRHRFPWGPVAEPIGFVIRGSSSAYFAGDTDLFAAMRDMRGTVDVALLPVWGWGPNLGDGHLDPARAARAAAHIEPRVAIPIHWGTLALPRPLMRGPGGHGPATRFAESTRREAPAVEVRLLQPGERTTIP